MLVASAMLMQAMPLIYGPAFIKALGPKTMLSNRDNMPAVEGWFTRAKRAHANLLENLVPFAAVVLVADAADVHTGLTQACAVAFFLARVCHFISYIAGVGVPRTLSYVAGMAATVLIVVAIATA